MEQLVLETLSSKLPFQWPSWLKVKQQESLKPSGGTTGRKQSSTTWTDSQGNQTTAQRLSIPRNRSPTLSRYATAKPGVVHTCNTSTWKTRQEDQN